MAPGFEVIAIDGDDPRLRPLIDEARAEDFSFMDRLVEEWCDATNRFDRPGECFLAVLRGGEVVAAGGLNRDPYSLEPGVGRVRHVYTLAKARRRGVGRLLLGELVRRSSKEFCTVRLRTRTAEGAAFYEAIGFARTDEDAATHVLGR